MPQSEPTIATGHALGQRLVQIRTSTGTLPFKDLEVWLRQHKEFFWQLIDVDGFGPWSVKSGMDHVKPPFDLLASMVTVRVHLDAVPLTNVPLHRRVLQIDYAVGQLPGGLEWLGV
jgi:hypothetical protein